MKTISRETKRNHWKLPAIVLAAVWVAACATAPPVADSPIVPAVDNSRAGDMSEKYRDGCNFCNNGDFDNAIRAMELVWSWNPDYEEAGSYLTRALLFSGLEFYAEQRYPEAVDRWKRALAVDPGNSKAKRYLARARQEIEKIEQIEDEQQH